MRLIPVMAALVLGGAALAQESASYKLKEHVFNGGGNPDQGAVLLSASFHIKLDAVGDEVGASGLAGASYHMNGGFVLGYPPPGEVTNLRFSNKTTLLWDPEKSAGDYDVYRDLVSTFPGNFGACLEHGIATETTVD